MKLKISVLLIVLTGFACHGQKTIKSVDGSIVKVKKLEQRILYLMDSIEMPGLSMAILNQNETVYHNVFGVQNAETKTPVNRNGIFEGASLSKPLFAFFAMKMVEDGVLDLDKPLHDYFPHPAIDSASQEWYRKITPRMVLSHSTGFPNHGKGQIISLSHQPGNGFSYSGEAYQYLTAILGMQHGVQWKDKFNAIFEDQVTGPLGMQKSSFLWNEYLAENKVFGHKNGVPTDNGLGGWSGKTFNSFSSLHSEAGEYARFIQAMLLREGLSDATFDEMLATQNKFDRSNELHLETGQTGWGLGFAQKETDLGLMHLHTGNNHDFQSYAMFIPDQQYGIVLFTNSDNLIAFVQGLDQILGQQF